mmetsp:Transcript_30275/g.70399  ORF Transcript_30275/g.70399 Transcript_30275/m.70399 type:complete len:261 (-) Transcript_30275:1403-2185(-)
MPCSMLGSFCQGWLAQLRFIVLKSGPAAPGPMAPASCCCGSVMPAAAASCCCRCCCQNCCCSWSACAVAHPTGQWVAMLAACRLATTDLAKALPPQGLLHSSANGGSGLCCWLFDFGGTRGCTKVSLSKPSTGSPWPVPAVEHGAPGMLGAPIAPGPPGALGPPGAPRAPAPSAPGINARPGGGGNGILEAQESETDVSRRCSAALLALNWGCAGPGSRRAPTATSAALPTVMVGASGTPKPSLVMLPNGRGTASRLGGA